MLGSNQKITSSGPGVATTTTIKLLGVTANGLIGTCPAGYALEIVNILENGGVAADINLGTVAMGVDIIPALAIPANSSNIQGLAPFNPSATEAAFNIFLSNNLPWGACSLDVYLICRKIK